MKKQTFVLLAVALLTLQTFETYGQKRPPVTRKTTVAKPAPASTPAPTPKPVAISPAQAFFNEGLKCAAEDYDCQISNYTKAINLDLKTKEVFKNRGNAYLQRKDFDKAIEDFTKLIELNLNDASGYKNRGRIYLESSNSPQAVNAAIKDFTSAIDLEPKDVEAYKLRGSAYTKLRDYDKAKADMDKIAAIEPNNVDVIVSQGEMFLADRHYDKAIESFSKVLAVKPFFSVYVNRGNAYASQKKYELALADFNRAIEMEPKNAEVYFLRGNVYSFKSNRNLALADYNKAIELAPNRAEFYVGNADILSFYGGGRGAIYQRLKQYQKCSEDVSKAVALDAENPSAYYLRYSCKIALNKYKQSEETQKDLNQFKSLLFNKASLEVESNPRNSDAYVYRGTAYSNLNLNLSLSTSATNNWLSSINDFTKAIELDPQNTLAYHHRASTYLGTKQFDLALKDYDRIIEIQPKNADSFYSRASANFYYVKNRSSALSDISKAIELDNSNASYFSLRGAIYLEEGKNDLAISDYSKAVGLNPDEFQVYAYENRARIYEKIGKFDLAVNDYSKIIELNPDIIWFQRRADAYEKNKQIDLAANDYAKIYELEPTADRLKDLMKSLIKSGKVSSALELYISDFCKTYSDKCFPNDTRIYYGIFWSGFSMDNETLETNLEKALPHYTNAIKENPQDVMSYLWRAEILSELGMSNEAIADYSKCVAFDEGKAQYCKGRIEGIKSNIASAEWERKRLKREKRNQNLLQVMGAITKGLETYNAARQNSSTSQTPQPNTSSRPQTTQNGGTSTTVAQTNGNSGDTVTGCNDGITRGGTGFDCHQFVTSGHIVRDESIRAGYWEDVCKNSTCSQWANTPLSQILFRGRLGRDKFAKDKPYIWTIGFKNTSNSVVVFFPELIYGDGTTQPGNGVALTPGSETAWDVTWGTNSGSSEVSIRIRKYAICSNISRVTDNGQSGYKCN